MRKTRPVVILSPDVMNQRLHTVLVAPLTRGGFAAPFRVPCMFSGTQGQVALDHLRGIDKVRLIQRLGGLDAGTANATLAALLEMFSE